jgi:glycosyltransferase involved in cell wall biosynthesis
VLYPLWLRKFRLDLMHFPHFNVPFLYRRPFVVTIHDLILLGHPTARATTLGPLTFALKFLAYRFVIARGMRDARAVITVSESVRREILERFPFMRGRKIAVTYEAVAPSVESAEGSAPRAEAVAKPFLLYVGNAYPHKNLERLLAAFASFRKRGFGDRELVLVGSPDYFYDRLRHDTARLGLDANVTFFGRATDAELAALYRRAEAYVFPSLCEGFGLPPLEAMANGLPVASSDAAAMPEILGDAALYFDAKDPERIADALAEIVTDADLRARLTGKGRDRVAAYDWRDCAQKTLDVYLSA